MKLLVQPGDGIALLLNAIHRAKRSVDIAIFRFNLTELEAALTSAAKRGVHVHALIAYTNRGGERNLRKLEMRLLAAGVTVARTADDLIRYHAKYMVVDRRELFVLAFNFTHLDIEQSRSFGVSTTNRKSVQEALRLFEADTKRQPYTGGIPELVVSPANARKRLAAFIKGAKKELLIYDPKIADPGMLKALEERAKAGVAIRIIGRVTRPTAAVAGYKLESVRLHTRTIIRDSRQVFMGSQSLREVELDQRREVGLIFGDLKVAKRLIETFQKDWAAIEKAGKESGAEEPTAAERVAKKVAKAVERELPPIADAVEETVKELSVHAPVEFDSDQLEESVRHAVKQSVRRVVRELIEEEAAAK